MTKRKLNLLAIAKQIEKDFEEVELTIDGEIYKERVYKVPVPIIWTFKPDWPEPQLPTILMRPQPGGRQQARAIKKGDKEWDEYQADLANYENESDKIQRAARFVLALAGIRYPDLSQPPPLAKINGIKYPANEILRKKIWLDYTLLSTESNRVIVEIAIVKQTFDAITVDQVEDIKKNGELNTEENQ